MPRRTSTPFVIAAFLVLAGIIGSVIGSDRAGVMHLEGTAHVGEHVASIEAGGWTYGISESISWIDAFGTQHDDGWPTCLGTVGSTPTVKFGAVPVTVPGTGSMSRPVVYVDCRP
jgi:hypothetical protein